MTPAEPDPSTPMPGLACTPDDLYWDDVANWVATDGRRYAGYGRAVLRGEGVISAAGQVDIAEVGGTIRIYGPQDARAALGFNRMTNWVNAENIDSIHMSSARGAIGGLRSPGTVVALGLNLVADSLLYSSGEYDRHEYAAALTVDTGTSIASLILAGAVAGLVGGALVGAGTGAVAIPIVGSLPGAVVGGAVGALAGIAASLVLNGIFTGTGARSYVVDEVADMYRDWTSDIVPQETSGE
jgi:hypothetical protein